MLDYHKWLSLVFLSRILLGSEQGATDLLTCHFVNVPKTVTLLSPFLFTEVVILASGSELHSGEKAFGTLGDTCEI